jgi:hypothetical protein
MSDQELEQPAVETTVQPETAPAPAPDLNLNDLLAMRNLIDVVTTRGAFKANELSSVGVLFDKLNAFLEAAQKQAATPAQGE